MSALLEFFDTSAFDIAIWAAAITIAILEFPKLKDLLMQFLMKLYEFFIQHNAENL